MQISGTGHCLFEGMDRRPFGRISGRFGIFGDSYGLLFANGGASLQLHRRDSALSGRVFTVGHSSIHHIRRLCCTALFELLAVGHYRQVACWRG